MNESERHVAETLLRTGRLQPQQLSSAMTRKNSGEGVIDALVRQGTVSTAELEAVLAEMAPAAPARVEPDVAVDAIRQLDRYVIISEIGRGGMGRVYLAYDSKLKRSVALKAMKTRDAEDVSRYRRELEIAAALQHPNIAAIYDGHFVDGTFIIAMQYVDGQSLGSTRLELRDALAAVAQASRAVHHAHEKGIIHRDLKPENLIRSKEGRVFVLDFGIAKPMQKHVALTETGIVVGTPLYMSPEQACGLPLDGRTDVYSLGATLYALTTHRPPVEGTEMVDIIRRVVSEEPQPPRKVNPRLHADVETVVLKAMSKDPRARYASAQDLAEDIERFLAGEPILARPVSVVLKGWRYMRRRPWAMATVLAVALGLAATLGAIGSENAKQTRERDAIARIEHAAQKIVQWERHLEQPPTRDLTPNRVLLEEAVDLCAQATRLAPAQSAAAHYHRARALIRLGREDEAGMAISEAIWAQPAGLYFLERARIRMEQLTRKMMNASQLVSLNFAFDTHNPARALRARIQRQFSKGIVEDLAEARRLGREAEVEKVYAEAVELALHERFEEAARRCEALLPRDELWQQAPGQQVELHRLLAWIYYTQGLAEHDPSRPDLSFTHSPALSLAYQHSSAAVDLRRSDADLRLFRAYVAIAQATEHWSSIWSDAATPDLPTGSGRLTARLRELDQRQRALCSVARNDIELALRVRPNDADAYLLSADVEWASIPLETVIALGRGISQSDLQGVRSVGDAMSRQILAAEAACRKAIEIDGDHVMAWSQLASLQWWKANFTTLEPEPEAVDRVADACARAIARKPEPHVEAMLRFFRFTIRTRALALGAPVSEEQKKLMDEDCKRIATLNPDLLRRFERGLPQPQKSGK